MREYQDELDTRANTERGVDCLGVIVDCVSRAIDLDSNFGFGQSGEEQLENTMLCGTDTGNKFGPRRSKPRSESSVEPRRPLTGALLART